MLRRHPVVLLAGIALSAAPELPAQLAPAPYVAPAAGMVYTYTGITQHVTRSEGWRTYMMDQRNRPIVRIGTFITDDPARPGIVDEVALGKFWPLVTGRRAEVLLRQVSGAAILWRLAVQDTETVRVPAGRFLTYRVIAAQMLVKVKKDAKPAFAGMTFWYSPDIAAIVKVKLEPMEGPGAGRSYSNELLSVKRP